jgi:ABC-type transport system involved in cytochrome bd biosynthesis fused ATPase/permease subunit
VSFRYAPDKPLIEDFTLDAAPGQTIAIAGPTGAGKTTVVNLLMRVAVSWPRSPSSVSSAPRSWRPATPRCSSPLTLSSAGG